MDHSKEVIFLSGGGTLGSVTPLLALAEDLGDRVVCQFVGTENGVEKSLVAEHQLAYHAIASGKLRRYFSLRNFIDPFFVIYAFFQSLLLIFKYRPRLIVSAGSFVSVPLAAAAKLCSVKVIILQLDVLPGLANRIMAFFGAQVALTLPESKAHYPRGQVTGCPVRLAISGAADLDPALARAAFNLDPKLPTILILAGGTGSIAINKLVLDNLYNLTQLCQVIHITGRSKQLAIDKNPRYHALELSDSSAMANANSAADLIVSRAGMGVITELAYLSKPVVLIPLPNSHQEANADYFVKRGAAIRLDQSKTTAWTFVSELKAALADRAALTDYGAKLHKSLGSGSNQKLLNLILKVLN